MPEKESAEKKSRIDQETAQLEVKKFLDLKRVPDRKRESDLEDQVKSLAELVQDGRLVFDFDAKRAIYRLLVPLETKSSGTIKELSMRFYIGMQQAQNVLKKVEVSNADLRSLTIAAALAGVDPNVLRNATNELGEAGLDISDHNSLFSYTAFFLT